MARIGQDGTDTTSLVKKRIDHNRTLVKKSGAWVIARRGWVTEAEERKGGTGLGCRWKSELTS